MTAPVAKCWMPVTSFGPGRRIAAKPKRYTGAGIGIKVPTKGPNLCIDNQARNLLITALRAPAERANALLKCHSKRYIGSPSAHQESAPSPLPPSSSSPCNPAAGEKAPLCPGPGSGSDNGVKELGADLGGCAGLRLALRGRATGQVGRFLCCALN